MTKRACIVGAGLGGLAAAIGFREAGHEVALFEAAEGVGGVWRDNRYPGCACDVPAILYQLSFAPNPHWSRHYARQPEILAYAEGLVDRFDLHGSLRLSEGVTRAAWDGAGWVVETGKGARERFDAFVPAVGQLSRPCVPDLPGFDSFQGQIFHSARWPEKPDLGGKRVGVVGTAASAVQLVPEVAKIADRLLVFQRSPNWIVPRNDKAVTPEEKRLMFTRPEVAGRLGAMQREMIFENADAYFWQAFEWTEEGRAAFRRLALDHLEAQVPDPELRRRLTPDYPIGCKRVLFADDFYPALMRDDVTLDDAPIRRVTPEGIETEGGPHALDVIVFATGFEATEWNWSFEVVGRDGLTLREAWRDGAEAYLGVLVRGFPNMFVIYGPGTNLGHNSITYMMERQVEFAVAAFGRGAVVEASAEAQRRWNDELRAKLSRTVWADPACRSWYKRADGRITQNWSGDARSYGRALAEADPKTWRSRDLDDDKRIAAEAALAEVRPGMMLGLGTGSTAAHMIRRLGRMVADGLDVDAVATSRASAELARSLGVRVHDFAEVARVDLTIDGADEIDDRLLVVKGAGGAMLREKCVAAASDRMVVIADGAKRVERIGAARVPVEALPFARAYVTRALAERAHPELRMAGAEPYRTDQGNLVLDCAFRDMSDPHGVAAWLQAIPGVLGHGLFLSEADGAYLAQDGVVTRLERSDLSL